MPSEKAGVSQEEQEKILHAKQEWEQTFDAVSDLIFIVDNDYAIVRANRAMSERCGLTPQELLGRKCYELMHDSRYLPENCAHAGLLKIGEPQAYEYVSEKLHGIFEVNISPVLNTEGRVQTSVHVARDVTEKRKIEKSLQESEQRFSVFMEHLPLAVTIKDSLGRVLFANEFMKDLLGLKTLTGLTARDLFTPDAALLMEEEDQEALSQGLGLYRDVICDYEGHEHVFDTYRFPIPCSDGTNLLGTISLDVTEKSRQEKLLALQQVQLEEINRSLESRIEKAITESRSRDTILIQQGRLNAMGEMISSIAHQWRQPLNNIGLIVQSLQLAFKADDLTVEELDRDIADTMKVLQQISETIDDFRNFFSHEEEASSFIINELFSRALTFIGPSLKRNEISIELVEEPDVAVEGYPNEYVQAVLNILLNARDAILDHQVAQPRITVRIFRENGRAVVTVSDNGGGIPEDVLPKIFEPYFTTKQQGKGIGIGLYMAKMIIEKKMHGSLTARNANGGAEFRIEL